MANICKNCGFEFDENENICPECNTELLAENEEIEEVIEEEISEDNTSDNTPADDSKASKAISNGVTVICIIMVILLALGLFYVIFIDNSNVPIKKFLKGIEKEINDKFISAFSDYMISDTAKGENFAKQINDMLEDTYGENIELDYEVVTKAEVEEDVLKLLNGIFSTIGDGKMEFVKSYAVEIKLEVKGDNSTATLDWTLDIAKLKGEGWVIFGAPADFTMQEKWIISTDSSGEMAS